MSPISSRTGRATARLAAALAVVAAAPRAARAQADTGSHTLANVRFSTGETLPEVRLHYRTLGRPHRDAAGRVSNTVLVLHGTGGSGQGFLARTFAGELFGPGQPLDTARTFVVIPDNVGHGRSTRPSEGLRSRFPRYTYDDMVALQRRLLRERFGVERVWLIVGTSMGCMHAWVWGTTWPDEVDGLVPLACLPMRITGRNRMWRHLASEAIRGDSAWRGGDYARQPPGLRAVVYLIWAMGTAPVFNQAAAPGIATADSMADAVIAGWMGRSDANDLLYAIESSREYDPSGGLGRVRAPVLAINFADDEINPPELGLWEGLVARAPHATAVLVPASTTTRGHGTHSLPAVWKDHLSRFLAQLPDPRR